MNRLLQPSSEVAGMLLHLQLEAGLLEKGVISAALLCDAVAARFCCADEQ
jgi:hypothetical protein